MGLAAGGDQLAKHLLGLYRVVGREDDVGAAPGHAGRKRGLDVAPRCAQVVRRLVQDAGPVGELRTMWDARIPKGGA